MKYTYITITLSLDYVLHEENVKLQKIKSFEEHLDKIIKAKAEIKHDMEEYQVVPEYLYDRFNALVNTEHNLIGSIHNEQERIAKIKESYTVGVLDIDNKILETFNN
jgi:hypothetical protein